MEQYHIGHNLQRITASASLINFFRVSSSFLNSDGGEMISMSSRLLRRSLTWRPVVPASPSINTLKLISRADDDDDFDVVDGDVYLRPALGANAEAEGNNKANRTALLNMLSTTFKRSGYVVVL